MGVTSGRWCVIRAGTCMRGEQRAVLRKLLVAALLVTAMGFPAAAQNPNASATSALTPIDKADGAARLRHALRERENRGLVGVISGDMESTDLRAMTDLATIVDGTEQ